MTYSLTWLPGVLRDAGLEVLEHPAWQTRGHGDMGKVQGVLCHHTCGPLHGDLPDINVLVDGRPDLGGPLCNIGLGRSGKVYMIAAGKGWHAGAGSWQGVTDGNSHFIGIEAENTGETKGPRAEAWPDVQMAAYMRVCAAIITHVGAGVGMVAGHKEYARPLGRKNDPSFDMVMFRAGVAQLVANKPVAEQTPHQASRAGAVNIDGLNVRSNASASSTIVGVLFKGDKVAVSGEVMNGTSKWLRVAGGYVAARYVDITA
ncbi:MULTISPECIES: N-acetylmuramoyl-L-alanine amidase [unclassified Bradyrhizobium]|uniref:N-acetylmuramoyl-L-alanine amidase n=1 Tax=unclassified Bradyrhizobium TaxID=2631580 RepID=UPI001FF9C69C|nr:MULTISPECIES: N-acetylmuramoyl-L-alanine amidase [unclassified Bradyrhizobium]MCK1536895.1 amidase [Bradyrhizobium sp. 176]MCK1560198.1 amidase [Bradyrhizobium sp. 171]